MKHTSDKNRDDWYVPCYTVLGRSLWISGMLNSVFVSGLHGLLGLLFHPCGHILFSDVPLRQWKEWMTFISTFCCTVCLCVLCVSESLCLYVCRLCTVDTVHFLSLSVVCLCLPVYLSISRCICLCLCKIADVKWQDRITNTDVLNMCGIMGKGKGKCCQFV